MLRRTEKVSVRRLRLSTYRNFQNIELNFSTSHVVFTGHNGAGKTNLLEALSFLSPGRGLRRVSYPDVILAGSSQRSFAVHARLFAQSYDDIDIGTGFELGDIGRKVRIQATPVPAERLTDYSRMSWLTPAMDGLFMGGAGDRRRLLDRLVLTIDPQHARRVIDYEKSMRSRNRLLSDGRGDAAWFLAIETQMAELGVAIAAARLDVIRLLRDMIEKMPEGELFPRAHLHIDGLLENELDENSAIDVEEMFLKKLFDNRATDKVSGRTLEGPHRSDLQVVYKAKNIAAALCSTGEQKALLTGIILSHARLIGEISGMAPILLLDEMAAHLDVNRRAALFDFLDDLGGQAFMTGTDKLMFDSLAGRAQFFEIANGAVLQS